MKQNILMMVLVILIGGGVAFADMRSSFTKINQFGSVLVEIEKSASSALSRMKNLKTRLTKIRVKAVNRFGVASPEVAEIDTVISNIDTQYIDAANAWVLP